MSEDEISELVRKIGILSEDLTRNIIFTHDGKKHNFCPDVLQIGTGKTRMALHEFGKKYSLEALENLLLEMISSHSTTQDYKRSHMLGFLVNTDNARLLLDYPESVDWAAGSYVTEKEILDKNISCRKLRNLEEASLITPIVGSVEDIKKIKRMRIKGTYDQVISMIDLWKRLTSSGNRPKNPLEFYKAWLKNYGVVFFGEKLSATPCFQELKKNYDPKKLGMAWDKMFDFMTKSERVEDWGYSSIGGKEYRTYYNTFLRHLQYLKGHLL